MKPVTTAGWVLAWALVVGACLIAALVASLVVFFLPLHWGAAPLPISVLVAAVAVAVLPRVCHALTGSLLAALAPAVVWFAVTAWLALTRNALYLQLPLAVGDWRLLLLAAVGGLAAAGSIGLLWGGTTRGRLRPTTPGASSDTPINRSDGRDPVQLIGSDHQSEQARRR